MAYSAMMSERKFADQMDPLGGTTLAAQSAAVKNGIRLGAAANIEPEVPTLTKTAALPTTEPAELETGEPTEQKPREPITQIPRAPGRNMGLPGPAGPTG